MPKNIHISVAWPYANGDLHVGHIAGAYLPADIFARYHRLKGNHVLMVSGSDSHGTPIVVEANKKGVAPRDIFQRYHERFLLTQQKIGISYDLFTHTDTANHHEIAQAFFSRLLERGYLEKQTQTLLYSEKEKRFLPDRFVEGTCYICDYARARGDQCDNCGNLMETIKLINPHSISDPDDKLIPRETDHYFLKLEAFIEQLQAYLARNEGRWRPQVINFSKNFVKDLHARPITRDIDWGIPIPLEGWEDKKMYVWFEAVMGYFTASVEWARAQGKPDAWKDWWYNPDSQIYCFIGKDNIPFHTVIWQSELLGVDGIYNEGEQRTHDAPLQLPYDVPANEFMNFEGEQFSKGRHWAIWLPDILERYQADAVRYYVVRTLPEVADSDFAWEGFYNRVNGELLAAWGNLVNRVLGFSYKRFDGAVPVHDTLDALDQAIISRSETGFETVGALLERVKLREALREAMSLVREVNAYLDERAPWKTYKEDPADAARSIYAAIRAIDNLNVVLAPFLPFSAQKVHEMLGYEGQIFGDLKIETYGEGDDAHQVLVYDATRQIGTWQPRHIEGGRTMQEPSPLFVKLEPEIIDEERGRLGQAYVEKDITVE